MDRGRENHTFKQIKKAVSLGSRFSRVVRVPGLDDLWDGGTDGFGQWGEGEPVKDHGKGVALGHPFAREDDSAFLSMAPEDELGGMAVTVEAEPGSICPEVPDGPEHGLAAKFVESVGGIDQEDGRCLGRR